MSCNYKTFKSLSKNQRCEIASKICESNNFFNIYELYYCSINENLMFIISFITIVLSATFYLIQDTANKYLSSSLTKISDNLKLSQSIAAMTFLAFGNGAPDIISSIVASSGNDSSGLGMSIGALLGSGMCITAGVYSLVIFNSKKDLTLVPKMYSREIFFYFLALGLIFFIAVDGVIYIYESILFLLFYICNLMFAVYIQKNEENIIIKEILENNNIDIKEETYKSNNSITDENNKEEEKYADKDNNYNSDIQNNLKEPLIITNKIKSNLRNNHKKELMFSNNKSQNVLNLNYNINSNISKNNVKFNLSDNFNKTNKNKSNIAGSVFKEQNNIINNITNKLEQEAEEIASQLDKRSYKKNKRLLIDNLSSCKSNSSSNFKSLEFNHFNNNNNNHNNKVERILSDSALPIVNENEEEYNLNYYNRETFYLNKVNEVIKNIKDNNNNNSNNNNNNYKYSKDKSDFDNNNNFNLDDNNLNDSINKKLIDYDNNIKYTLSFNSFANHMDIRSKSEIIELNNFVIKNNININPLTEEEIILINKTNSICSNSLTNKLNNRINNNNSNKSNINTELLKKEPGFFYRIKRHYFSQLDDYESMSILNKIVFIFFEIPFNILRDLSIPAVEQQRYNNIVFSLFPLFSFLTFMFLTGNYTYFIEFKKVSSHLTIYVLKYKSITEFLLILAFICIICIVLYIKIDKNHLPKQILLICFVNFGMSIIWISVFSDIIVDLLTFLGVIFNLPSSFLGLTLLAIGNSIPDAALDTSLAKSGYGEMAISGTHAGPLFNLIIGLGFSLLKRNIVYGPIEINFFEISNISSVLAFFTLCLNLFLNMHYAYKNNFTLKRSDAYRTSIIFLIYNILLIIIAIVF